MISDVLSDAREDIRAYLDHEGIDCAYGERGTPLREWIESVVTQIEALRAHLDASPQGGPIIRGTCRQCGKDADVQTDYGTCAGCIASSRAKVGELIAEMEANREYCPTCHQVMPSPAWSVDDLPQRD